MRSAAGRRVAILDEFDLRRVAVEGDPGERPEVAERRAGLAGRCLGERDHALNYRRARVEQDDLDILPALPGLPDRQPSPSPISDSASAIAGLTPSTAASFAENLSPRNSLDPWHSRIEFQPDPGFPSFAVSSCSTSRARGRTVPRCQRLIPSR